MALSDFEPFNINTEDCILLSSKGNFLLKETVAKHKDGFYCKLIFRGYFKKRACFARGLIISSIEADEFCQETLPEGEYFNIVGKHLKDDIDNYNQQVADNNLRNYEKINLHIYDLDRGIVKLFSCKDQRYAI